VPVADGALPAYCARPFGVENAPVVVVIEEVFGVHEYIKDVCRRLAKLGYLAVAPELYARLADLSTMADPTEIVQNVILKAPDETMLSDLGATVNWAVTHHGDRARFATLGFCRGGRDVWLFAEHDPRLKAAIAFYGAVADPPVRSNPRTRSISPRS
jgi:carboxymethylenebutenolidase